MHACISILHEFLCIIFASLEACIEEATAAQRSTTTQYTCIPTIHYKSISSNFPTIEHISSSVASTVHVISLRTRKTDIFPNHSSKVIQINKLIKDKSWPAEYVPSLQEAGIVIRFMMRRRKRGGRVLRGVGCIPLGLWRVARGWVPLGWVGLGRVPWGRIPLRRVTAVLRVSLRRRRIHCMNYH